jgi:hypothetical protein
MYHAAPEDAHTARDRVLRGVQAWLLLGLIGVVPACRAKPPAAAAPPRPMGTELAQAGDPNLATREKWLQLQPGGTDPEELYRLIGHPTAQRGFPEGVALR